MSEFKFDDGYKSKNIGNKLKNIDSIGSGLSIITTNPIGKQNLIAGSGVRIDSSQGNIEISAPSDYCPDNYTLTSHNFVYQKLTGYFEYNGDNLLTTYRCRGICLVTFDIFSDRFHTTLKLHVNREIYRVEINDHEWNNGTVFAKYNEDILYFYLDNPNLPINRLGYTLTVKTIIE